MMLTDEGRTRKESSHLVYKHILTLIYQTIFTNIRPYFQDTHMTAYTYFRFGSEQFLKYEIDGKAMLF
jgi:hypothetical protein